jgi:creatinine amidohydrolase/Fe(II)-dependent formamide hydrolase-like protein
MDGLAGAMKKGAKTFEEAGGEDAYFGDPTAATAEDGEIHLEALTEIVVVTIMELLASKA